MPVPAFDCVMSLIARIAHGPGAAAGSAVLGHPLLKDIPVVGPGNAEVEGGQFWECVRSEISTPNTARG